MQRANGLPIEPPSRSRTADPRRITGTISTNRRPAILVVAEPSDLGRDLSAALERRGYAASIVTTAAAGIERLEREGARLLVLVLPLPDALGRDAIARIRAVDESIPFVVAGEDAQVQSASDAFDLGAQEYLGLPLADPADFLSTVGVLLGSRRGDRHLRYLHAKDAPRGWQSVVGQSPALSRVLDMLRQVCARTVNGNTPTIMVNGETGTGKGFVAKTLHYNGVRRNRPFVEVNCAAIPASLIESELFGHESGSFTDAKTGRSGLFETADGGTLFLDEIGSVPLDLQAKLLTAIEEKNVRRIGGRQPTRVDVQIIAATHDDLAERVKRGTFRHDLYHRLHVVAVTMPPLRERGTDVILLAETFLATLCREYGMPVRHLAEDAMEWLRMYSWPGNVRELRNQIERIVLLENGDTVRAEHFRGADHGERARISSIGAMAGCQISLPPDGVPLALLEREILRTALSHCEGNVSRAARYLSISRQTLMYRMKKHHLGDDDGSA